MAPDSRRAVDLQCSEFHLLTELRIGGAGTIHCPQQKYTVHEGSKDGHSRLWVYDATEKTSTWLKGNNWDHEVYDQDGKPFLHDSASSISEFLEDAKVPRLFSLSSQLPGHHNIFHCQFCCTGTTMT